MKKIITAVVGMMAAGITYLNAQTNTSSFWDQNVTFILVSQSSGGHAALSTKVLIQDLIGASVTNAGTTITTNPGINITVTNAAVLALASGNYTNAATISNFVTVTFTNGQSTNVSVVSTQTTNSPPTFTFSNTAVTSTNNETLHVLTNASAAGTLTAVLVTTNGPGTVFTVTSPATTSTNTSGGVVTTVTNTSFASNAKLIARQSSPSGGNLTNQDQFLIVEGVGKKATIVADVTPFFKETFGTLVDSITPNKHYLDFGLTYTGKTITFESRGVAAITTGNAKGGISERKVFNGALVGAGVGNGSPIVVSGKFNMTGGQIDTQ